MKTYIKKTITLITMLAVILTLAAPLNTEAARKTDLRISKNKVTLTITKKKLKPSYQLKFVNIYDMPVKWTTSNKKVVTVSKNGKITGQKKGTAVVSVKIGKTILDSCKVTVKDKYRVYVNQPIYEIRPVDIKEAHIICNCGVDCGKDRDNHMLGFDGTNGGNGCLAGYSVQMVTVRTSTEAVQIGTKQVQVGTQRNIKVDLTITEQILKPSYQLKLLNTAGMRVKWTTSNKNVATVSKSGKIIGRKKGTAVVTAKIGKKTLTCKVTVKDNRV